MSYLLLMLIWPNFANVVNYIILGFIWIIAVFVGTFQTLSFRASNSKGLILQIHQFALKAEFWTDQFMKTIAMIGHEKQMPLYIMLALGGALIGAVTFKALYDLVLIFTDSKINSSSNKSNNAMRYIFCA